LETNYFQPIENNTYNSDVIFENIIAEKIDNNIKPVENNKNTAPLNIGVSNGIDEINKIIEKYKDCDNFEIDTLSLNLKMENIPVVIIMCDTILQDIEDSNYSDEKAEDIIHKHIFTCTKCETIDNNNVNSSYNLSKIWNKEKKDLTIKYIEINEPEENYKKALDYYDKIKSFSNLVDNAPISSITINIFHVFNQEMRYYNCLVISSEICFEKN